MAVNKGEIAIYGKLVNDTNTGILAGAEQIYDSKQEKNQAQINEEILSSLEYLLSNDTINIEAGVGLEFGEDNKLNVKIVDEKGNSEDTLVSQKFISDEFEKIYSEIEDIKDNIESKVDEAIGNKIQDKIDEALEDVDGLVSDKIKEVFDELDPDNLLKKSDIAKEEDIDDIVIIFNK